MSLGLEKCRILDTGKNRETEDQNREKSKEDQIEDMKPSELYRYLGTEQCQETEHSVMKEEFKRKFVVRLKQVMRTGLNSRNVVMIAIQDSVIKTKNYIEYLLSKKNPCRRIDAVCAGKWEKPYSTLSAHVKAW